LTFSVASHDRTVSHPCLPLPLPLLLLVLLGWGAPLQAQTLLDVTAAGAAQGALNNTAMPQYAGALSAARAAINGSQSSSFSPAGFPGSSANGAGSAAAPEAAAPPLGTPLAQVNGRLIDTCSSGQLCLSQIRSAMGMR
jgi:type IV secretory pathway TrbL component